MKVAIDTGPLRGGDKIRGVGYYTREIYRHLQDLQNSKFRIEGVDRKSIDLGKYDILHIPYFNPYFINYPFRKQCKIVANIHDMIPLIYPKNYPSGIKGSIKLQINKLLLKKVDRIIAITQTTKKDIMRFFDIPEEKITVTYLSQREQFNKISDKNSLDIIRKKYHLPKKFVLYVGDVNYNKNILSLAEACELINTTLVIVGKQAAAEDFDRSHIENRSFMKFLDKYANNPLIMRLGFVPDEDITQVYNLASVYAQPSLYEGFGLPVIEAMACGTPVVIAKTQALVEISGEAAFTADPHSADDFAGKIKQILDNYSVRKTLSEKGVDQAKRYSWKKTATQTCAIYREIINNET